MEDRRERLLKMLEQITALDAPSADADSLSAPADLLARWAAPIADRVIRHGTAAGDVIEIEIDGGAGDGPTADTGAGDKPTTDTGAGDGPIGDGAASDRPAGAKQGRDEALVLCHYDTVWPLGTVAERPFHIRDGVAHGPGVLDMRGGIVAALGALQMLRDARALRRGARILITPDEESGSAASKQLILDRAASAAVVLVPEPALPRGALKTERKGWIVFRVQARGRAAHAGLEPELGVSAIDELVDRLHDVRRLADPDAGTTLNCGELSAPNPPNVVADFAEATIDVRVPDPTEEARVRRGFAALSAERDGATLTVQEIHCRPPLERTPAIAEAASRARSLARLLGLEIGEGSAGGVSDANLAASTGVPVLDGLGPEGGGAHAVDEHVIVESLLQRTALIALLLAEL